MVPLKSTKLLNRLPPAEIKVLEQSAKELKFADGQEIFKEGDPGDGFYVVKSGEVKITGMLGSGSRFIFGSIPPGDIFGEMAVIENMPRSATATADGPVDVYFIPRDTVLELMQRSPHMSIALVKEISERLRDFNRQYIRQAVQSEQLSLVGRFASSVIHDLKSPLLIIGMSTELACAAEATQESRVAAQQRVSKQIDRIRLMVNDVLEFSKGSHAPPPLQPTDYATFVHSVIEEFEHEVGLRGVKIEFANEVPTLNLLINPQRLSRVFWNLIMNAVDALPGGGKVILRFTVSKKTVLTEVEDTGKGIAPQVLDNLFEAFATFGKPQGTGLGLSITRKIVQEHGGKISAQNQPGGGAVFSFILPRSL